MTEITSKLSTALADRYKIERHLGEGGMATVYLAEDLKHKRKVAVKVLRPELAAVLGAERFVQEITTTANLQHPHILPLFDSGEADGFLYYVMPYIEGETLRDKLNRESQLSIDEAVKITTEVADALDYAHRASVIHRDIKPENILLHDGRAMVADFGIALAVSAAAGGRMTETGLSLGTPHYMSPEQATAEKDLTNRSDIYSLGTVLYELLAGAPPHLGGSAQQIIMKIVTDEARPITELRKSVPPHVAAATAKSLEKLAADRFESAAKFAEALMNPAFTLPTTQAATVAGAPASEPWTRLSVLGWSVAAVAIIVALWGWLRPQPEVPKRVLRYSIALPEGEALVSRFARLAISPNGSRLVYIGESDGARRLWVRPRDQLHATPLAGTEGADAPFLSPDGDRVGFFIGRSILRVASLRGGPPVTVTDSLVGVAGASWGPDGFLYSDGSGFVPLVRVAATGGVPQWFTTLDSAQGEIDHVWPDALPNGKGVIFTVRHGLNSELADIAVAEVATGTHKILVRGVYARYAASGHLVYVTADGTLMGQPFDQDALELRGEATALLDGVALRSTGGTLVAPDLTVSVTGTLMYSTGAGVRDSAAVVWVTRDGTAEEVDPGWIDRFQELALSRDGAQLAVSIATSEESQIWIKQLNRGPLSKLTFDGVVNIRPSWTPDGRSVAFVSGRFSARDLFVRRADGTALAEVLRDEERQLQEVRYSDDGEWMVYRIGAGPTSDLHALRVGVDSALVELVATEHQETEPALSPDSRWLAYVSDETGRSEIYVRPFPNAAEGKWQVSTDGGTEPAWAHSGRELFYRNGRDELVRVEVLRGATFVTGDQQVLFSAREYLSSLFYRMYDVTPDDQRFVMLRNLGGEDAGELIVVENFFEELKAKVGN